MAKETFTAQVNLEEGLTVNAESRGHEVVMDESEEMGGKNKGMNPIELALCSLGGCLAIAASAFAKSAGVELNDFSVDLEGDVDLDGFLKGAEGVDPGFEDVRFTLNIDSDSPKENIEKLIELIENRCPISDSLQRSINVDFNYEIN